MTLFPQLILRTEESVESTIEPIVTEYSDVTIPVLTIVMIAVGALLIIAAVVAAFLIIKKHGRNWGLMLLTGLASYLIINYMISSLLMFGVQKIPGAAEYMEANPIPTSLISLLVSLILEFLSIFLGLKYGFNLYAKRNLSMDLPSVLMFGLAFLVGAVLISKQLTYSLEYILFSTQINKMGFDPAVTSMVQNGADQDEAMNTILTIARQNSFGYLFDSLSYITRGIADTCAAVIMYGVMSEKLEKKHYVTAGVILFTVFIPGLMGVIFGDEGVALRFAVCLVYAAGAVFVTWKLLSNHMQEDLARMKVIVEPPLKRKKEEPKKMPKINMPKD